MEESEKEEEFKGWEWADRPSRRGKIGKMVLKRRWLNGIQERALRFGRSLISGLSVSAGRARESKGEEGSTKLGVEVLDIPKSDEVEGRKGSGNVKGRSERGTFGRATKRLNALNRILPSILALAGIISLLLALLPAEALITEKTIEPNAYELIPCIDGMLIKSDGELCYDLKGITLHPAVFPVRFPVIKGNGSLVVKVDNGDASDTFEYELVDSGYAIPVAEGMYNVTVLRGIHRIYDAVLKPVIGRLVKAGDGIRVVCSNGSYLIAGNPTTKMVHISIYRKSYDILRFVVAIFLLSSALATKSRLRQSE